MIHLFQNGLVEVPRTVGRRDRLACYRWVTGYSQMTNAGETQPLTRRHWYAISHRDAEPLKFHPTKTAAKEAVDAEEN